MTVEEAKALVADEWRIADAAGVGADRRMKLLNTMARALLDQLAWHESEALAYEAIAVAGDAREWAARNKATAHRESAARIVAALEALS